LGGLVARLGAAGGALYLKDPTSGAMRRTAVVGPVPGTAPGPDAVPLRAAGGTVGAIEFTSVPAGARATLPLAAQAMGLAMHSAQLFTGLQERARDLDREVRQLMALREVAAAVSRVSGTDELARVIAAQARRLVRADAAAVVVQGPRGPRTAAQEGRTREVAWTAALAAIASGRVQVLPGPQAAVPVPGRGGRPAGALVVARDGGRLGDDEAEVLTGLAEQAGVALANLRLVSDLRDEQDRRERVAAALVQAQEMERRRVAEDLHDGPVQELVGLGLMLDALAGRLASRDEDAAGEAREVAAAARRSIGTLREAIFDLHPMSLDQLGFAAAVRVVLDRVGGRGIATQMHGLDALDALPLPLRTVAFRIVQEAVANAARHSRAHRIVVRAGTSDAGPWVEVTDDGLGFTADAPGPGIEDGHLGLAAMRERALLAGAALDLHTGPGQGTTIRARFTLPRGE
jgi:signal transduction histidine kinase